MNEETLDQAIQLSKSGRTLDARKLLRPILEVEPENEKAWLWYANSFESADEKIKVLQNCLAYNPNSKMANDGIRSLVATLSPSKPAPREDASGLAVDLQNEKVQFSDSEEYQNADQEADKEYYQPTSNSTYMDNVSESTIENRLQGMPYQDKSTSHWDSQQQETARIKQDAGYMDSPFFSENVKNETGIQADGKVIPGSQQNIPSSIGYRIPFIIMVVFGVILFLLLAVVITILVLTR